ncbi:MAG: hypothetical protein AAFP04_10940 [Myxococcota bacterium]
MRFGFLAVVAMALLVANPASAEIRADQLGDASWYLHVDLGEMKKGPAGSQLYAWLQREIFSEIQKELKIDVARHIDRLTAIGVGDSEMTLILDGPFPSSVRKSLLEWVGRAAKKSVDGKAYYRPDARSLKRENIDVEMDDPNLSFALDNRIVFTTSEALMKTVLRNNGTLPKPGDPRDALMVLSATRSLVQAGGRSDAFNIDSEEWDSKLLRNTQKVALLVADLEGQLGLDARLQAKEPELAESLANVIRGLIGLSYFSEDDSAPMQLLRGTRVRVESGTLRLRLTLDPDTVVSALTE